MPTAGVENVGAGEASERTRERERMRMPTEIPIVLAKWERGEMMSPQNGFYSWMHNCPEICIRAIVPFVVCSCKRNSFMANKQSGPGFYGLFFSVCMCVCVCDATKIALGNSTTILSLLYREPKSANGTIITFGKRARLFSAFFFFFTLLPRIRSLVLHFCIHTRLPIYIELGCIMQRFMHVDATPFAVLVLDRVHILLYLMCNVQFTLFSHFLLSYMKWRYAFPFILNELTFSWNDKMKFVSIKQCQRNSKISWTFFSQFQLIFLDDVHGNFGWQQKKNPTEDFALN